MSMAVVETLDTELAALATDGFAVLERVLDAGEIAAIKTALAPHLATTPTGRNKFEGLKSQRVYALVAKDQVFADLVSHPRILRLLDRLLEPNYLLSAALAISHGGGEDPQQFHYDDGGYHIPRPRPHVGVSTVWAIDEFTAANGATELIPGSHRWGEERPAPDDPRARKMAMPAGSVVVFVGTMWHRGGRNTTERARLGITPQYCQPWARQLENMTLAVPPDVAARCSPRVQELLGYSIHPPLMGYVNGMHPARLIDPDFGKRDRADARRAAQMLEGQR
ncbi:MAG TPA: phytanoyl-CoA dioxygenase family protein [Methylomirabilota bacterium]|nr:phytanoyl-CoA dioxygenase family protein [Methylomirabilota bacterium]